MKKSNDPNDIKEIIIDDGDTFQGTVDMFRE